MKDRWLFKARRVDNGEWITGFLFMSDSVAYIIKKGEIKYTAFLYDEEAIEVEAIKYNEVNHETICQCTGLKDKSGELIFEGDEVIVPADYFGDCFYEKTIAHVIFDDAEFLLENINDKHGVTWQTFQWGKLKLTGRNIHDKK